MELFFNNKTYKIDSYVYESFSINEDDNQNSSSNASQSNNQNSTKQEGKLPEKSKLETSLDKVFGNQTLTKQYIDRIKHNSNDASTNSSTGEIIDYSNSIQGLDQYAEFLNSNKNAFGENTNNQK